VNELLNVAEQLGHDLLMLAVAAFGNIELPNGLEIHGRRI